MPWIHLPLCRSTSTFWSLVMVNHSLEAELLTPALGNGFTCRIKSPNSPALSCCLGLRCGGCLGQAFPACSITETAQTALICGNDISVSCVTQIFSFSCRGRVVRERENIKQLDFLCWVLDEQCSQPPFSPRLLMCSGSYFFSTRGECGLLLANSSALPREAGKRVLTESWIFLLVTS